MRAGGSAGQLAAQQRIGEYDLGWGQCGTVAENGAGTRTFAKSVDAADTHRVTSGGVCGNAGANAIAIWV